MTMMLAAAVGGALIRLSAPFNDIADASGGGATAGNTVTLSMSVSQTIVVNFSALSATVRYSLNGGAFTSIGDGGTISVSDSNTLRFDLSSAGVETFDVTLTVNSITLDTWTATCT